MATGASEQGPVVPGGLCQDLGQKSSGALVHQGLSPVSLGSLCQMAIVLGWEGWWGLSLGFVLLFLVKVLHSRDHRGRQE